MKNVNNRRLQDKIFSLILASFVLIAAGAFNDAEKRWSQRYEGIKCPDQRINPRVSGAPNYLYTIGASSAYFSSPYGVAVNESDYIYITDYGANRVEVFNPSGIFNYSFGSTGSGPGQFNQSLGVAVNGSGCVYVVDSQNHRVEVFSPTGAYLYEFGSYGSGPGQFGYPVGVALNASGCAYIVDNVYNRVEVFDPTGAFLYEFGSPGTGPGQFQSPNYVVVNASECVYVVDNGNHRVQVFNPAGNFLFTFGTPGSNPGQFSDPGGIAVNETGGIYVADSSNNRVEVFDMVGTFLYEFGSYGTNPGQFNGALGICLNSSGCAIVVDFHNYRVELFNIGGGFLTQWVCGGSGPGQFNGPEGVAINASGCVYVTDTLNNRVEVFDPAGTFLYAFGSSGSGPGQFFLPVGIAINASGCVFVADSNNDRVEVFDPAGTFLYTIGSYGNGPGQFNTTQGIGLNDSGCLYVADVSNDRIDVFDPDGIFLYAFGSSGSGLGQFDRPLWVALNGSGCAYVTDSRNNHTEVFDPAGTFLYTIGSYGSGPGQFQLPVGVSIDESGYAYIVDAGNNRIEVFDPAGIFLYAFGSMGSCPGQFQLPVGVMVDGSGCVYVTEWGNDRVQVFGPATIEIRCGGLLPLQVYGASAPAFALTIIGSNIAETWYSLDGGLTNTMCALSDTLAAQWDNYGNGTITITFWANDTGGNVNSTSIVVRKDILAPIIMGTGFVSYQVCGVTAPPFTLAITEGNLNKTWYSLDGGLTNTSCGLTGTLAAQWDGRGNGSVTVTFWANDTLGNMSATSVVVLKDILAPNITGTGLGLFQFFGTTAPSFSLAITEVNLASTWYTLDGGTTNTTCGLSGTLAMQWGGRGNGSVTVIFWAKDTLNNVNATSVTVWKDILAPAITVTNLPSYSLFETTPPIFTLAITEGNLASTWYTLGSNPAKYIITGNTSSIDTDAWAALPAGNVTIHFHVSDIAGNEASTDVTVTKMVAAAASTDLPSWAWFLLLGSVTAVVIAEGIVILKQRHTPAKREGLKTGQQGDREAKRRASEETRARNLQQVLNASTRLPVRRLASVLGLSIKDAWDRAFDWAQQFKFRIEGEDVVFNKDTAAAFVASLAPAPLIAPVTAPQAGAVIFISYKHDESELFHVPEIATRLRELPGIAKVLYSERDVTTDFVKYMDDALTTSHVLLLCCSPAASQSEWVRGEWRAAYAKHLPIIPMFTSAADIPPLLKAMNGVQFNPQDLLRTVQALHQVIQKIVGEQTSAQKATPPKKGE